MSDDIEDLICKSILVVDDSKSMCKLAADSLKNAGYTDLRFAMSLDIARSHMATRKPDLLLLDIHMGNDEMDGLDFLHQSRLDSYEGVAVVFSSDSSAEQAFRAVSAGANDFLLKGKFIDIPFEVSRLLRIYEFRRISDLRPSSEAISEIGFFRSYGLSTAEIDVLTEFCRMGRFPPFKELALELDMTPELVRRHFSNIYKKFKVDNTAQLVFRLTIGMVFYNT